MKSNTQPSIYPSPKRARVFLDTNVLLDVLARRPLFFHAAAHIWTMAENGIIDACISAISFNNIHYVIRRQTNAAVAQRCMEILLGTFTVVPADKAVLARAIAAKGTDFEDNIQFYSALASQTHYLLTRNPKDFPQLPLAILSPEEFLQSHIAFRD